MLMGSVCFFSDIGFEVPDAFLVGYALDYNEYFRDLSVSLLQLITSDGTYQKKHLINQHQPTCFTPPPANDWVDLGAGTLLKFDTYHLPMFSSF